MELFEAALAELSCLPVRRVAALVYDRGGVGLNALLAKAGLPETTFPAFRAALEASHEVGFVGNVGGATRLRRRMVERVLTHCETGAGQASDALLILLRRFATESAREEARVFCDELADENDRILADDFVARLSYPAAEADDHDVAGDYGYDDGYDDLALIPQDLDDHRHLIAA
jgi:hypothetical protein